MKKFINWTVGILLLLSLIFNGIYLYRQCHQSVPEVIYLHDTVTITKDSLITKLKYVTKWDTIIKFQYIDTLQHDTLYMSDTITLPIEHKVDSFSLKKDSLQITEQIHYSGFHAQIDSVQMSYELLYDIPKTKQKKFGIVLSVGPYAGYGISFKNGQYFFSPEVGVGAQIGFGIVLK